VLGSETPPERLAATARVAEELGYGELWFAEDCFFIGGIAGATATLTATREVPIGLGIVSALVRHPAILAMEIATVARMYPGRLRAGIGLGVPDWMRQIGLYPKSALTALRECVSTTRRLLAGEEVTFQGDLYRFDRVRLTHVPSHPVPMYMGVVGPKNLQLSGEIADGTVISVLAGPAYVRWLRERVREGAARSGRSATTHRVACYVLCSVDKDRKRAREAVRPSVAFYLAAMGRCALTDVPNYSDHLEKLIATGGLEAVTRDMPDEWLDELAVVGDPVECAEKIRRYLDAGADSVVVWPAPTERTDHIVKTVAKEVFPLL
jgi:alkanesulfonate monooxygenase SsuD/methylene tetrahydromethanopterin reductase-like flavin-dependent oxidoreductase (luciferase family)